MKHCVKAAVIIITMILAVGAFLGYSLAAVSYCPDGNHNFGEWVTTNPGNCGLPGEQMRRCTNILPNGNQCLERETRFTGLNPDIHGGLYVKNAKEATCTVAGYTGDTYCSMCFDENNNHTFVSAGEVIPPTGHNWGEWTEEHGATCIIRGTRTRTCQNCGKTDTISLLTDPAQHMAEPVVQDIAPSCLEPGTSGRTVCPYCKAEIYHGTAVPPAGHVWSDWTALSQSTCTAEGTEQRVCTVCGIVENRKLPYNPNVHTGRTRVSGAKNPGCDTVGYTGDTVCQGCSAILRYGETIPVRGHSFGVWVTVSAANCTTRGKEQRVCAVCGDKESRDTDFAPDNHTGRTKISGAKRATCDTPGYTGDTVCAGCGEILGAGEAVPATGHVFGGWSIVSEATCSVQGRQERRCAVCGDTESRSTDYDPDNHTGRLKVSGVKAADCDSAGYTGDTVCYGCGAVVENGEVIPASGHDYGPWIVTSAPTCTAQGTGERICAICGKVETNKLARTAEHHWGEWQTVTSADCSTQGREERICSDCRDKQTRTTDYNPTIHTGKTKFTGAKNADCDTAGYTGDTVCAGCSVVLVKGETVPATGHNYGGWKVILPATCTAQGTSERTCVVCGKTETNKISRTTDHNWGEWQTVTVADCSTQGKEERICSVCGDKQTKTTEYNPAAHSGKTKLSGAKNADCDTAGYTGDTVCSGCGVVLVKGEAIPAAGHEYGEWKVITPATCNVQGTSERTCSVCGKTETSKKARTVNHTWGEWQTVTSADCSTQGKEERICSVCGDKQTRTTDYDPAIHTGKTKFSGAKNADCDTAGYTGDTVCSGCGAVLVKGETVSATGHDFGAWTVTIPATCTAQGTSERTCSACGKTETSKTARTVNHTWGEWQTVTSADCSTQGKEERICSVCGDKQTRTTDYNPAVHTGKTKFSGAKNADCDTAGYTGDTVCSGCGAVLVKGETVSATGHDFGAWTVTIPATCTAQGTSERTCSVCGKTETSKTARTVNHTWGEWQTVTSADCSTQGKEERICSVCGDKQTRTTDYNPAVHTGKTKFTGAKNADCDTAGYTGDTVCSGCGVVLNKGETVPANGHTWNEWQTVAAADCSTQGKEERYCSVCGDKQTRITDYNPAIHTGKTKFSGAKNADCDTAGYSGDTVCSGCGVVLVKGEAVPANGHTWDEWQTVTAADCSTQGKEERYCSVCGDKQARTTDYNPAVHNGKTKFTGAKTADCDTAGYTGDTVCSGCGVILVKGETVPATGHDFGAWKVITPATCTAQGTSERTCSVCGKTEINKTARTADHNRGEWQTVTAADCSTQGKEERACSVCGDKQTRTTDYNPAIHTGKTKFTGVKNADCDTAGYTGDTVCSGCGVVLVKGETVSATGHDFGAWKVITPATCTAQGTSERTCSVCGKTETNKTARTVDHNWGEWQTVTSADCSVQGKEERACSVCGDKQTRTTDYNPAIHTGKTKFTGAKNADCDTAGYTGDTVCSGCGAVLVKGETIPANGHIWGEWQSETAADCSGQGKDERYCSVCGDKQTRSTDYNPAVHSGKTKLTGAKTADCDTSGYTGDTVCSGCGVVLIKGETIPAAGHDYGEWKVVAPASCAAQGTSERACAVCGKTETAKTARTVNHTWDEWQTVTSADCSTQGKEERYCSICGDKQTRTTDYNPAVHTGKTRFSGAKNADCDKAGYTGDTVCSGCGVILVKGDTVPATGHTWNDWQTVTAADCATQGKKERYCSVCGDKQTRSTDYDPAIHTGKTRSTGAKNADCVSAGYSGDTVCSGCGVILSHGAIIPATGHSFGDWSVYKAPTCSSAGERRRTCSVCGKAETESLARDGSNHSGPERLEKARSATCETAGYSGDAVCSSCGKVVSHGHDIPASGHKYGELIIAAEPTPDRQGIGNRTCALCGAVRTEVIPYNTAGTAVRGDLNGDGVVNAADIRLLQRFLAGITRFDENQKTAADLNGDGAVDKTDLELAKRLVV